MSRLSYSCMFFVIFLLAAGCTSVSHQYHANNSALAHHAKLVSRSDTSLQSIETKLLTLKNEGVIKEAIFRENITETSRILFGFQNASVKDTILSLSSEQPERTSEYIEIALALFPQAKTTILEELRLESQIDENAIFTAALKSGLSPDSISQFTASGQEFLLVPLINSTSITLFNKQVDDSAQVQFRKVGEEQWNNGGSLYWEPIRSALSGSIVHLSPNTEYEIQVTEINESSGTEVNTYRFATRQNTPPVDPDKVYKLSDIYNGGMLDLGTLGIEGTRDGWAKIVGDSNTKIIAGDNDDYAINVGNTQYVMFENITVEGGRLHGIYGNYAHDIWIKGCDVSRWGRSANNVREGIGYENEASKYPINYDGGIALRRTGRVVVENCKIHSPNAKANHWGYGHPKGPSAMIILATHPTQEFAGQYIIRNNHFAGTNEVRFNDVIESRANGRVWGGFVRDSAIHDNYLAYANDDIIELDGGQSNVLFYNNEVEQGYCGVSAIPNMLGPSYIFNNYIHNLGDERQKHWGAIKLGGLFSKPGGIVNIFDNLIITGANGIAPAGFAGDSTYWVHAQNNIMVHDIFRETMGYSIHDPNNYPSSKYINNFMFNTKTGYSVSNAIITVNFEFPELLNYEVVDDIVSGVSHYQLPISLPMSIPNFTHLTENQKAVIGIVPSALKKVY